MGSGKSSLGRAVSRQLNMEFRDLDQFIIEESGLSISEFLASRGELAFRKLERQLLLELSGFEGIVSCGGGTPCYFDNADWMCTHGNTVYLSASVNWLHMRLSASQTRGKKRPLLKDVADNDLAEFIAKHLFERLPFYQKAAYKLAVDKSPGDQLVQQLAELIQTK